EQHVETHRAAKCALPAINGRVGLPAQLTKRRNRSMRIRPIALCLGLAVTLARISHTDSASGLRIGQKLFCENDLSRFGKAARCRRSVAQNRARLDGSRAVPWWPSSMAAR